MRHTFEEIARIVRDLQEQQGPTIQLMKTVLDRYGGDYIIPFPSLADEPALPPLTPLLVAEAVDGAARYASSVNPRVLVPAIDGMKDMGVRSREYARIRRRMIAVTYQTSKWQQGVARFYRHIAAYHTSALIVVPDFRTHLPRVEVRDPLGTVVEPQAAEELRPPEYVGFITRWSQSRLRKQFPAARIEQGGVVPDTTRDDLWDIVEWYDDCDLVYGIVGPVDSQHRAHGQRATIGPWMELARFPNKTGMIPAVVPHNVGLGPIASRIGSMVGSIDLQAKLTGLDIIAQEKAIFPDMYAIGRAGGSPVILSGGGKWQDGREGNINLLRDVESIGMMRSTPDSRTPQLVDRLERNFRISNGVTPQQGGESYGALRTGRGIDALLGAAVDPRILELHRLYEAWMPHLNSAILATFKGYFGDRSYSMYSSWPSDRGLVEFTPSRHVETLENAVSYAIPGADVQQATQILGALFGAGVISRETFRAMHPYIDDAEAEAVLANEEQFEGAFRDAILQQVQGGQLPLEVAIIVRDRMRKGDDIFQAVKYAQEEAQRRQATPAGPAPEGMMADPATMPGLAAGPEALTQPEPTEQVTVPGDATRMRQLMQTMGA